MSGMGLNCVFGTPPDETVAFFIKKLKICWFKKKTSVGLQMICNLRPFSHLNELAFHYFRFKYL